MNEVSFEGLLTDYALGEMSDPDTKALLEALLERDESLRASLTEIRSTTELIVLAGPESLVSGSQSKRSRFFLRPSRLAFAAVAVAAAVTLMSFILWWPTSTITNSDPDLVKTETEDSRPSSKQTVTPAETAAGSEHPLPWIIAAAEKRNTRPSRRGAGIRWSALVSGGTADRQ